MMSLNKMTWKLMMLNLYVYEFICWTKMVLYKLN